MIITTRCEIHHIPVMIKQKFQHGSMVAAEQVGKLTMGPCSNSSRQQAYIVHALTGMHEEHGAWTLS